MNRNLAFIALAWKTCRSFVTELGGNKKVHVHAYKYVSFSEL